MGKKEKIIALIAVLIFIFSPLVAFMIARSISIEPDTKETIEQLQTISNEIVKQKSINQLDGDIKTELSYKNNSIRVCVSTNVTKVVTELDENWNIMSKEVQDLSSPFSSNMISLWILFAILGELLYFLFIVLVLAIRDI